jgi:hypothetical protein
VLELSKEENLPEGQKSKSKTNRFIWGFLIMLLPYVIMFISFKMYHGYGVISSFFLAILFMFIGLAIWAITNFRLKKRSLALGFLIGGFAPFLIMFIFTGGCGIFIQP